MPYDSAATRARLLDAAYAEFSERGLAGARVDRIAATAEANKQAIYAYFGSKEGLFDATLGAKLSSLADAVPFTPDDLPKYAGELFDAMQEHPELLRLSQWSWLERGDASAEEVAAHADKAKEFAKATGRDLVEALDVLQLVISLCTTWSTTSAGLRGIGGLDPAERTRVHRAAVVKAATAVTRSGG